MGFVRILSNIIEEFTPAHFFVAVASGTPHMHACWLLLTASGEITSPYSPCATTEIRDEGSPSREPRWICPFLNFQPSGSRDCPISVEESEIDVESVRLKLGIVGDHPAMQRSLEMGAMLAPSQAPILILGETGTGKELFARYIHRLSGRPLRDLCCRKLCGDSRRPC